MVQIYDIREKSELLLDAIDYFWNQWGSDSNVKFYQDCIERSSETQSDLPRFYIAMEDNKIIGSYALLRSDLNSRQDLFPWFACLYIEPDYRRKNIGTQHQNHAITQVGLKGYGRLYLCTDLSNYYEKNKWNHIGKGYSIGGDETRVYEYEIRK